ncbi:MerR family transcriptional regulator [Gorillibacterium timonense]|uniref:MerR family transcriptional regulator n=1 Tax=Gorillibacterium timonense TaxID=1689269 RepID=UPI00071D51F5|nr:MerR family transcriptional regulator [Gorillibacterium timonense]
MRMGQYVNQMSTTLDTVRYYMELSLLRPELKNNRYDFTQREMDNFETIVQLKEWGFAMKEIQELFEHKERTGCGSVELIVYARDMLQAKCESIECSIVTLNKQKEEVLHHLGEVEQLLAEA